MRLTSNILRICLKSLHWKSSLSLRGGWWFCAVESLLEINWPLKGSFPFFVQGRRLTLLTITGSNGPSIAGIGCSRAEWMFELRTMKGQAHTIHFCYTWMSWSFLCARDGICCWCTKETTTWSVDQRPSSILLGEGGSDQDHIRSVMPSGGEAFSKPLQAWYQPKRCTHHFSVLACHTSRINCLILGLSEISNFYFSKCLRTQLACTKDCSSKFSYNGGAKQEHLGFSCVFYIATEGTKPKLVKLDLNIKTRPL